MKRFLLLFILAWGILGVPVLCMAGSLLHECECGAAVSCAHEESCSDDPCSEVLVMPSGPSIDMVVALPKAVAIEPAPLVDSARGQAGETRPPLMNLPFPPSQRPLLN